MKPMVLFHGLDGTLFFNLFRTQNMFGSGWLDDARRFLIAQPCLGLPSLAKRSSPQHSVAQPCPAQPGHSRAEQSRAQLDEQQLPYSCTYYMLVACIHKMQCSYIYEMLSSYDTGFCIHACTSSYIYAFLWCIHASIQCYSHPQSNCCIHGYYMLCYENSQ